MTYLIGQLSLWLFLTGAFAALAGWAFAARRSAPHERSLRRERDNLMRDLAAMALGEAGAPNDEAERRRSDEAKQALIDMRDGRIAELEQALERLRDDADESASRLAEMQRRVDAANENARELDRLRRLEEAREQQMLVDAHVEEPEPDQEDRTLQAWRLRYFEQRVRYLESLGRPEPAASAAATAAPEAQPAKPSAEDDQRLNAQWAAREADARAQFLADEVRRLEQTASPAADADLPSPETPFAANADVDMLLRWRLLYLERRVAHLQAAEKSTPPAPVQLASEAAPDPDRWKWRARYLEARVRHLEQRAPAADEPATPAAVGQEAEPAPPPPPSDQPRRKPAVLASPRNGAPDDLTLIEGVSALQQSTLYSIGVFHFDQIAAWSAEHVAWVDDYLRLRGRIDEEEWVEQAAALSRELAGV